MKQTVDISFQLAPNDVTQPQPPFDVGSLLAEARALHEAGRLDAAATIYRRILTVKPDHFDSLHLLGVVFYQCGNHAQALRQIETALAISPDNVFALNNRGIVLNALARFEEALASCDRALAVRPNHVEALLNRGNALKDLKRFAAALQSYDRALAVRPDYVEALSNRAVVLSELKQFGAALASCDRALALRPDFAEAHSNRGNALHALERFEEALASYDRALALRPDFADARVNRGGALHALKRLDDALADYDRALALMPNRAETHYNRGNTLHTLKRFDDALASYDRALALRPDYVEALANRGVTLHDLRRFDQALSCYERVRAIRPDFADAHYNEALCRLLLGDLVRGFDKHEWRWETEQHRSAKRNFPQPLWTGSDDLAGKTVLLHAEQGFGDTIQFCRYAPQVAARAARVVFEVQEPLRALMATLPGMAQIVSRGETLPEFDMHCPLLSLPRAFATRLETVPNATPYLHASTEAVAHWKRRLGVRDRPRIGLAWSGLPTHKNDHNRSIDLAVFLHIFAGLNATFVRVQRDVRAADEVALRGCSDIIHFGDELKDFSDTAALIANLDLVVAVDTSVAHLVGALAKPVWVLLPFNPDWRWLLDRDDNPWYPTARLFRQDESRRWETVIARASAALRDYLRNAA